MDQLTICKFYQKGMCFKDDSCPFSHPTQRCRSFTKYGFCPYGVHCHYWHDPNTVPTAASEVSPSQKVCRFFLIGQCVYGDACAYSHDPNEFDSGNQITLADYRRQSELTRSLLPKPVPSISKVPLSANPSRPAFERPSARLEQAYLTALQPGDLDKMRDLEVDRLLKRFPPNKLKQTSDDSVKCFSLLFSSTDPDWSHKVEQILLTISLPPQYPSCPPSVIVPRTFDIPHNVTKRLNEAIANWLNERQAANALANKVSLYLRPFLFWLDKTLGSFFTDENSAVEGMDREEDVDLRIPEHFDPPGFSNNTFPIKTPAEESISLMTNDSGEKLMEAVERSKKEDQEQVLQETEELDVSDFAIHQQNYCFEGLEMRGQTGTCLLTRLPVYCFCLRCKYTLEWVFRLPTLSSPEEKEKEGSTAVQMQSLSSIPPHSSSCPRCRQSLGLVFTAELMHSFASRAGTFQLVNCLIFEVQLQSAEAVISCVNCSNAEARITGLRPERVCVKRCQSCHSPCGIFFTSVSISKPRQASADICKRFNFISIGKSAKKSVKQPKASKQASGVTNVIIQKGTPLPNNGTCRHYRQSFRWLRFPCCQRAFPCDACHDEEIAGTHETLRATRTICGFCSVEQPVLNATVVCSSCQRNLTSAAASSHWEGGQGCRDPIKMSRKDNRKYNIRR